MKVLRLPPLGDNNLDALNRHVVEVNKRLEEVARALDDAKARQVLTGDLDAGGFRITNIGTSQSENDAISSSQMQGVFDDIDDAFLLAVTSEGSEEGIGGPGNLFRRGTSRFRRETEDAIISAIEDAVTGTPGQVAFFTADHAVRGDAGLTYNDVTDSLTLDGVLYGGDTLGDELTLGANSALAAPGVHIQQTTTGLTRLLIGPGPDPTAAVAPPDGVLQFIVTQDSGVPIDAFFGAAAANADPTISGAFIGIRARGTLASPLETLDEDVLFKLFAAGYDNTDTISGQPAAQIFFYQDGNAGAGFVPGRFEFATTDTAGTFATRVTLHNDGELQVGDNLILKSLGPAGLVIGTHDTTGVLVLAATDDTTLSGNPIILNGFTTDIVGDNSEAIRFGPGAVNIADDPGVSQARFSMLSLTGPFIVTDDSEGGPSLKLLNYRPEITNTPGVTDILDGGSYAVFVLPAYTADTDACTVNSSTTGVGIFPSFAVTNGGTISGGWGCIDSRIDTQAGVSLGFVYGMFYEGVKGSGSVDTDVAFQCIDATATVNTVQRSLSSDGPLRELNHRGRALFGVVGSPATSAGIELQSTTTAVLLSRMDDTEEAALTAVEGMVLYNEDQLRFRGYEDGAWTSFVMQLDTVSLQAQTATIGDTNLANTGTPGLFRVSVYALTTTGDAAAGSISVDIKYTDDFGAQTITVGPVLLTVGGTFAEETHFVQTASGNVTYGVTNAGGFGTADYSLYVTAERL